MSSAAQIAANRRNAQNSTGPRTLSGLAASSLNAMKSGIFAETLVIRGESAAELEQLTADYHLEFRPATARERDLVDSIVRNEWMVRRMGLIEAELWGHHLQTIDATLPGSRFDVLNRHFRLGQGFIALSLHFERLQRRVSALERATCRALQELAEIRNQRHSLAEADSAQPSDSQTAFDPIGFVPSTHQGAPSEDRDAASPEPQLLTAPIPNPQSPTPIPDPVNRYRRPIPGIVRGFCPSNYALSIAPEPVPDPVPAAVSA